MVARAVVLHPDARLRVTCAPVARFDSALRDLAADMLDTMYAAMGRGLAAPQVGSGCRLFVMDAGWKEGAPAPRVLVNPVIVAASARTAAQTEACLSIPGQPRRIARPATVRLRWQDQTGRDHSGDFDGIDAVIVQHEIDHLDGVLILDHPQAAPDTAVPA